MESSKKTVKYYIDQKQYIPGESDLLCSSFDDFMSPSGDQQILYRTKKGAFFLVQAVSQAGTKVVLLDKEKAFEFMDKHPEGIDTEVYNRVFGEPERG